MILNLTQHQATEDQKKRGVFEVSETLKSQIRDLLTFDGLPKEGEVEQRAKQLARLVSENWALHQRRFVMVGGAPFFMPALCQALKEEDFFPLFAFSKRIVEEDAEGKKVSRFVHEGFVDESGNPIYLRACFCGSGLDWTECGFTEFCG